MTEFDRANAHAMQSINGAAFNSTDFTTLRWLGGAGFMINSRGTILMIDPVIMTKPGDPRICETGHTILIDYPISAEDVPKIDAVFYSHSDGDHMGAKNAQTLS